MAYVLGTAVHWFCQILILLLCVRAIMSWIVTSGSSSLAGVYRTVIGLTEPFVAPIRKLMSGLNTGPFDFSVLVAFFAIEIAEAILVRLIYLIF